MTEPRARAKGLIREFACAGAQHLAYPPPDRMALEIAPTLTFPKIPDDRNKEFVQAARDDSRLSRLSPGAGPLIWSNLGHGWRIDTDQLASSIIDSALFRVVLEGGDPSTEGILAHAVESEFDNFCALIDGESLSAPTYLAIANMTLADRLDLPWGSLFPIDLPKPLPGRLPFSPTAILRLETSLTYELRTDSPAKAPDDFHRLNEQTDRVQTLLPLASLMALDRNPILVPTFGWLTTLFPAQRGRGFSIPRKITRSQADVFHLSPPPPPNPLSDVEGADLQRWAQLVEQHFEPSIEIAARRIVTAVLERDDPADALIDAVIAHENLFGHGGSTEVAFRVTSAIAILLEDPDERRELQKQLQALYSLRSKVVHGGHYTADEKFLNSKDLAISIAIRSLRVLFSKRTDLLTDQTRGMRLILKS